jgi:hypothetical protein
VGVFFIFLSILFLEFDYEFFYFFLFFFWQNYLNKDLIVFQSFLKKPYFFKNDRDVLVNLNFLSNFKKERIYFHTKIDLIQIYSSFDFFFFFYNIPVVLKKNYLWQPLFKKHSYYMFFRSNREFWLNSKYK